MNDPEARDGQQDEAGVPPGSTSETAMAGGDTPAAAAGSAAPDEGAGTSGAIATATAPDAVPAPAAGADAKPRKKHKKTEEPVRPKHPFYLRGRHLRLPRSRRGLFALLLVLMGFGGVAAFSAVSLVQWTETADFCGRCHTMSPELQAYDAGPHRDVACAECHVEPGIMGWVKAKMKGTQQLVEVVLGTFPTPIPPPDHADMPSPSDTCQKCHSLDQRQFVGLRTKTQFSEDQDNTRQFVGLMIRPGGGNTFNGDRSVHWHVLRKVEYSTPDEDAASIDYVFATQPDGSEVEYISQDKINVADNVLPDIAAIKSTETSSTMTCYDCHNRVGHNIANPRTALDYDLYAGVIDPSLPYIKRQGMRLLWATYADEAAAGTAIDALSDFYAQNFPDVSETKGAQITAAEDEIKVLYRLTATPEMKVTGKTYPNHMGHTDFPGCFRCHDGGHFLVKDGVATKTVIPSTCDTCHTFPQIGPAVASLPLGEPPTTHNENLWVFSHSKVATGIDPGGQTCGECHARDYCVNCHSTGAVTIKHDEMATNHAKVIRTQGNTACAYCHQPVYCARCHKEPVLPVTTPFSEGTDTGSVIEDQPTGVTYPLTPRS
ncbi:MAG: NapC/NirT family cytochrome c [Chloroflexota bacterium]